MVALVEIWGKWGVMMTMRRVKHNALISTKEIVVIIFLNEEWCVLNEEWYAPSEVWCIINEERRIGSSYGGGETFAK